MLHAAAAGVLFRNANGHVLMVTPSYKNYLDLPGGFIEKGEAPLSAAQREVKEELGIRPPVGKLLVADWWTTDVDGPARSKLLLVFDGATLDRAQQELIRVDGREVTGFQFVKPTELDDVTIPRLVHRIRVALEAVRTGDTYYLEDGQAVSSTQADHG